MNFEACFIRLIGLEGSYVNDAAGEMRYGLRKRDYPTEDIAGLTLERAKALYLRDFWGPAGCDALPGPLKYVIFEMAVGAGVKKTVKALQNAVGEPDTGVFDTFTLQAVQTMGPGRVCARFFGAQLMGMTYMPMWGRFSSGWTRRVAKNLMEC